MHHLLHSKCAGQISHSTLQTPHCLGTYLQHPVGWMSGLVSQGEVTGDPEHKISAMPCGSILNMSAILVENIWFSAKRKTSKFLEDIQVFCFTFLLSGKLFSCSITHSIFSPRPAQLIGKAVNVQSFIRFGLITNPENK